MAHARCAEDERSESEGRFGKAEPRRGAQASAFALGREVFAAEPRPRKRRTSAVTRKSCAVEQIRDDARARENNAELRGINAQVCENDARRREIYAQRRKNDAGRRETKKPTDSELFNVANKTQSRFQMFYTELKDF